MRILTLEEHRTRIENLRRVTEDTKKCTRDWRIHDYLPGQVTYYLGDYPALMSITPTEYDYKLLKSYAENGVGLVRRITDSHMSAFLHGGQFPQLPGTKTDHQ